MGNVINTNVASIGAQRSLGRTNEALQTTFQRLSTGLRINSAKDDAAGLQISNQLTSQISGLGVAVRNANDGVSLAQTAEGALQETTNILQRIRDLSVQSSNGTNSVEQRDALNAEVTQLRSEVDRIANTTRFGSRSLLNGGLSNVALQVGAFANESISISIASARGVDLGRVDTLNFDAGGFGTAAATASAATAVSGLNVAQTLTFSVGNTSTDIAIAADATAQDIADAVNGSVGKVSAAATTGATVTFGVTTTDGTQAFTINGVNLGAQAAGTVTVQAANLKAAIEGDARLSNITVEVAAGVATLRDTTGADIIFDDIILGAAGTVAVQAIDAADVASGTSQAIATGQGTVVTGDVTFTTTSTDAVTLGTTQTGAGITTAATATPGAGVATDTGFRVSTIDISTFQGAQDAIGIIDAALTSIDSQRGDLGAIQNRLGSTIANLGSIIENVSAARSRIRDTDFAAETAELAKNQVLQQAGLSILAQANASSQSVLSLLQ
ncbi:MAG: flagellin [Kangiellaceae bacterium]|nr:flagellin [Kangiellaceae bacterium]